MCLIKKEQIVSNVSREVGRVNLKCIWKDGAKVGDVWSASRKLRPAY